ncbi:TetR/AcrR family transcriptional regulator [Corallococcus sp. EGB]|uniref:TetR/AcrR family transcriptional regulator n=1 Tax=Corallococcus sp. EGB TaxID=1521117 RepID=UPI001CBA7633|nr:TetR/AcrR family transcriptional regulator [Corallococcus sp. EGB]
MEQGKPLRADGRRNRERIVEVAAELVARDGAQVSLEEIARRAGVGSATLHRHFPSRQSLLEVIFRDGVAQLCARAAAQPGKDPAGELASWLEEVTVYTATHRGLAAALLAGPEGLSAEDICCTDMLLDVMNALVVRASSAGALHSGATPEDLMMLANAIAVANENDPHSARRVLRLALNGIRPSGTS